MDKLKEHIERAYDYLAKIPVKGDAVDLMAMARQELRAAYQINTREEEDSGQTD